MTKDQYANAKTKLRKEIKEFLNQEETYCHSYGGCLSDAFDEDTREGQANILLNKALNLML